MPTFTSQPQQPQHCACLLLQHQPNMTHHGMASGTSGLSNPYDTSPDLAVFLFAPFLHSLASCTSAASQPPVASGGEAAAQPTQPCTDHLSSTSTSITFDSCPPTPVPAGIRPSEAMQLLLQLFKGLEHSSAQSTPQRSTPSSACSPTLASLARGSSSELLLQANCTHQPGLGIQLEILVGGGDGQMRHIVAGCNLLPTAVAQPVATARMSGAAVTTATATTVSNTPPPTAAAAGAGAESVHQTVLRCFRGSCSTAACCAASCEVLRCMTVLVLMDRTGATATDPSILQGGGGCRKIRPLIDSSQSWTGESAGCFAVARPVELQWSTLHESGRLGQKLWLWVIKSMS